MKSQIKSSFIAALAAVFGCGISAAHAAVIPVFSTGVDEFGTALPNDSVDPHYTVIGFGSAVVPAPNAFYAVNTASSKWISQAGGFPADVMRSFVTTFDLTDHDPATAIISGSWGADNYGLAIKLNGVDTGVAPLLAVGLSNFSVLHAFTISTGFLPGLNTLEFVVDNDAPPGALRVDISGTANALPAPAAGYLLFTALAAVAAVSRH
jgi:hypothetical protein